MNIDKLIAKPVNLETDDWITDKGKLIKMDVFVGCCWEWDNRASLLDSWWEVKAWFHSPSNCYLTNEMKLVAKPDKFIWHRIKSLFFRT